MNAAWGGLYDSNLVELCLSASHKTTKNINLKKAGFMATMCWASRSARPSGTAQS